MSKYLVFTAKHSICRICRPSQELTGFSYVQKETKLRELWPFGICLSFVIASALSVGRTAPLSTRKLDTKSPVSTQPGRALVPASAPLHLLFKVEQGVLILSTKTMWLEGGITFKNWLLFLTESSICQERKHSKESARILDCSHCAVTRALVTESPLRKFIRVQTGSLAYLCGPDFYACDFRLLEAPSWQTTLIPYYGF